MAIVQSTLFNAKASKAGKKAGMEQAADNRVSDLELARSIARGLCRKHGKTNADEVGEILQNTHSIELGPASGSIFASREFEFTGERIRSARKKNHARELKVWRLKQKSAT